METKLDVSFPNNQFLADGYKTVRKDYTDRSGGVVMLVRNDIPHK